MGSFPYPKEVALPVILMIQEAMQALLISENPVVTSSPRVGLTLRLIESCLNTLHRSYGPFGNERRIAASLPGQVHELDEVEFARLRLNDASVTLIPFTEETCLVWVKQYLERALRELDEGQQNGEFDDDNFDGGLVDSLLG